MASLKTSVSPVKMSSVSFSFADTSFEKVYAKLQKEVKFLESLSQEETQCSHVSPRVSPCKLGLTERLIYVNPDQKTFRIGSLRVSNDCFVSPSKEGQHQLESAPVQLTHAVHATVRDESFFDFPDEGIATVDVESSEPALDIKNFKNLLSYESDSALDEYDDERFACYFSEEDEASEEREIESSFSVDPHFYHDYYLKTNKQFLSPSYNDINISPSQRITNQIEGRTLSRSFDGISERSLAGSHLSPKEGETLHHEGISRTEILAAGCFEPVENYAVQKADKDPNNLLGVNLNDVDSEDAIECHAMQSLLSPSKNSSSNKKRKSNSHRKPKFDVYKHIRADGDNLVEGNSKVYHCGICGNYAALSKETLERHWRTHYMERPHKCTLCEKAFGTVYLLNNHLNTHKEVKDNRCDKCEQTFTTKSDLVRHYKHKHSSLKPFKCPECEYATVESSKLKRHMRTHTGERPFKCHMCDYSCTDNFKLKRHLKVHTGEKPFSCPICGAKFSQHGSMKLHVLGHTDQKPVFQCEYCSVTCSRKGDLKQHMLNLHTSNKPQRCRLCQASFPDRHNLKQHMRRHRGEKLLKCHLCQYKTNQQKHLQDHIMIHTGEKPHICSHCGQQFRVKQQLRNHIVRMHPELRLHHASRNTQKQQQPSSAQTITVTETQNQDQTEFTNVCALCYSRIDTVDDLREHLTKVHQWSSEQVESALSNINLKTENVSTQLADGNNISLNDLEPKSSEPVVPTIIVTCTPDQVLASVFETGTSNSAENHEELKSIEAIFMLPNAGAGGLSVMVDPRILESDALLQSLQTALEQNTTMKSIAAKAYQSVHGRDQNYGQLPQSLVEENGSETCKGFSNELIDGNSGTQSTCNLPEFSTIDATVLQTETQ